MRKGRNRRHREARRLKQSSFPTPGFGVVEADCPECRSDPHAVWCLADDLDDGFDDVDPDVEAR